MKKEYSVLDLFCGAGGFSSGFAKDSYNIVAGIDNDPEALITFKSNHSNSIAIDVDLSTNLSFDKYPLKQISKKRIDVIIGGPPCQGLSIAGKRILNDDRNVLYKAYIKIIEHFSPKAVVLENVPTIMSLFGGKVANAIVNDFEKHGYTMSNFILTASEYGVPQKRKRAFFVGIKCDKKFIPPEPTTKNSPITTEEAIGDLPLLNGSLGGEEISYNGPAENNYQKKMRKNSEMIYNHWAVDHKSKTKKIIAMVPDGGNYKDLPKELWKTRKVNIAWTRMDSKKPCFTIDAGHNHHFHYKANRVPTVRECARIQSFTDTFRFYGKKTSQFRQVGNAVPPLLAQKIAKELRKYI